MNRIGGTEEALRGDIPCMSESYLDIIIWKQNSFKIHAYTCVNHWKCYGNTNRYWQQNHSVWCLPEPPFLNRMFWTTHLVIVIKGLLFWFLTLFLTDACVKYLQKQAGSIGLPAPKIYQCVPGKPIVIITWVGLEPQLPSVLLNSHMDVVPVFEVNNIYNNNYPFSSTAL